MYNTFDMGLGLVIAIPKEQVGHALDVHRPGRRAGLCRRRAWSRADAGVDLAERI